MANGSRAATTTKRMTVGLDLGDRYSYLCLLDPDSGEALEEGRLRTTPKALKQNFSAREPMRVAIEAGTHSPWVSRLLEECGHQVLVANPRKLHLIYKAKHKTDKLDAENLARLARLDPKLLSPLKHRGESSQAHLALLRSRETLIGVRTQLINHVRGAAKSLGHRLPKCSAESFHKRAATQIPELLRAALEPLVKTIASLSTRIKEYDLELEAIARDNYPETNLLRQVQGVGTLTALAFVLILEDPYRFAKSRAVGAYLGLAPGNDQSGNSDPQQHISKEGDEMLRRLLVGSAHYILGPFAQDSDLRRHGMKIGDEDSPARWQKREEESRGGGGEKALGTLAPPVGNRGGL
jgi:transposase